MTDATIFYLIGSILVLIGAFILMLAAILMTILRSKRNQVKTAGVMVISPVPIIFGSDKRSVKTILALSIILTTVLLAFILVYHLVLR